MKTKTSKAPARPWTAKSKARAAKLETPPLPAPPAAKPKARAAKTATPAKARTAPEALAAAPQPAPLATLPALTSVAPPAAAPVTTQQPALAPKPPRNLDKAPAAVGRPVRAGTMNGNIVAALLRGSTIDEIRQCGPDWDRSRATARLWGVWKAAGIGYKVSEGGRYTIDLPPNLTPETAIKQVAAPTA